MGENTVIHPSRLSVIKPRGMERNKTVENEQHYAQQPNNISHASSSDSWYQQFGISTNNESMDDTMMQELIPEYILSNASVSTFASNYGNIWLGNRI